MTAGPSQLERKKNGRDGGADPALIAASRVWLLPRWPACLLGLVHGLFFFIIILCLFLYLIIKQNKISLVWSVTMRFVQHYFTFSSVLVGSVWKKKTNLIRAPCPSKGKHT
jgi:hypothetical protein